MITALDIIKVIIPCPVCDGEGTVADGLDEAACSIPCPPCAGTGYDPQPIADLLRPHPNRRETHTIESGGFSPRPYCTKCGASGTKLSHTICTAVLRDVHHGDDND